MGTRVGLGVLSGGPYTATVAPTGTAGPAGSTAIIPAARITDMSFLSGIPPAALFQTIMSADEINAYTRDYNRLFNLYLQQRDLLPDFEDAYWSGLAASFIVKAQLAGKTFGGMTPQAGQFGFTAIRPESWYAQFATFGSTPITTGTEIYSWDFTTPATTPNSWYNTNPLWSVYTNNQGQGLLQLQNQVAFHVPFLMDANLSTKLRALQWTVNGKQFAPTELHTLPVQDLGLFRNPADIFAGINSQVFSANALVGVASAADTLAPLGLEFQVAEYIFLQK